MLHCIVKVLCMKSKFNLPIFINDRNFIIERIKCTISYTVIRYTLNKVIR